MSALYTFTKSQLDAYYALVRDHAHVCAAVQTLALASDLSAVQIKTTLITRRDDLLTRIQEYEDARKRESEE